MDVHHHAHLPEKGENKFKHYFFQFFMLFLAVFCGFLAEYQLEHVIEHKRENQFMESMLVDLKQDSANLIETIAVNEARIKGLDSLFELLGKNDLSSTDLVQLYKLLKYTSYIQQASLSSRTLSQLKNSGSMRLIRNQQVSDSLNEYDAFLTRFIEVQGASMLYYQRLAKEEYWKLFNVIAIRKFQEGSGESNDSSAINQAPPALLTTDRNVMIQFMNKLDAIQSSIKVYVSMLQMQYESALGLHQLIMDKYDLK